jgi:hypothetical protein
MGLGYNGHLRLQRPAERDPLGRPSGDARPVYHGPADLQEKDVHRQTSQGDTVRLGQCQAFLPESSDADVQAGDEGTATFSDGTQEDVTVSNSRSLDGRLVLRYKRE